jgi:hypothetical protein
MGLRIYLNLDFERKISAALLRAGELVRNDDLEARNHASVLAMQL